MVRQTARFHLTMLLSKYNNRMADMFAVSFEHRERERSSDKSEIIEINDFWYQRVRPYDAIAAKYIRELPVDNIDDWLDQFDKRVIDRLLAIKDSLCRANASSMC